MQCRLRPQKNLSAHQQTRRKRMPIIKDIWIVSGLILIALLQNPVTALGAIVVFLATVFGVFMFLDEVGRWGHAIPCPYCRESTRSK